VREAFLQPPQRIGRPHRVGQLHGQIPVDQRLVRRVGEQPVERVGDRGERAGHRQLTALHPHEPAGVQLHQPHRLAVPRLGERVGERAARVPQVVGEALRAVEVPERHVVDTVEHGARDLLNAAHGDGPLGRARRAARDERVRQHHRPHAVAAIGQIDADPAHGLGEHPRVPRRVDAERLTRQLRLEVRDPIQRNGSVHVVEDHRLGQLGDPRTEVQAAGRRELGERPQPRCRVVVAGRDHQLGARLADAVEHPRARRHGLAGGDGAVVEITGHHHRVDPLVGHQVGQPAEHRLLVGEQVPAVEHPSHVPVGGVQHPHAAKLGRRPEETADATLCRRVVARNCRCPHP
jgi:hypothetical protein